MLQGGRGRDGDHEEVRAGARGQPRRPAAMIRWSGDLGLVGDGEGETLSRRCGRQRDAGFIAVPKVASTGDEMHWSSGSDDKVSRPALKTKAVLGLHATT